MPKQLTPESLRARALAYEEAAEHLGLNWTNDSSEQAEGDLLARAFHLKAARLRAIANAREFKNPLLAPIGCKP